MKLSKRFYAVWAEDINQYLGSGFNTTSLKELREQLLDIVDIDEDDIEAGIDPKTVGIDRLLGILNVQLDVSETEFESEVSRDGEPFDTQGKIILPVKRLSDDDWSRPRLKNVETNRIYTDIACGDARNYEEVFNRHNIDGYWHSTTERGEPDCPLKDEVYFDLIE